MRKRNEVLTSIDSHASNHLPRAVAHGACAFEKQYSIVHSLPNTIQVYRKRDRRGGMRAARHDASRRDPRTRTLAKERVASAGAPTAETAGKRKRKREGNRESCQRKRWWAGAKRAGARRSAWLRPSVARARPWTVDASSIRSPSRRDGLIAAWRQFGTAAGLKEEAEKKNFVKHADKICSWKSCLNHVAFSETPNRTCKGCGKARYCSRVCQVRDWKVGKHKQACQRLMDVPTPDTK
ncbi:hypothetical protein PENSPDRAFT_370648 [Peniophora sp. CONT]|nr:hypothetical protein PENSPDRAFT_370648 [Peniophora sp. CONT]